MRLTFLEAEVPSTKTFKLEGGELQKIGHPRVIDYLSHWEEYDDIQQFHDLLVAHADLGHCLLKGNTTRELKWESRRGSTDPNEPTTWACFDIDGFKDLATPGEFMDLIGLGDVDRIEQYSASAGILPERGLSAHVFCLMERAMAAPLLKQHLMQINLSVPKLRSALGMTRTHNALRWTLDVSTCQSDKLIYIAPPLLGEGVKDGFKGKRIRLVKGKKRYVEFDKVVNAEVNRRETFKALNQLREAAGLEKRERETVKTYGTVEYMAKPDRATVTGCREERGFVYLNLNGGDSWAYYHPKSNPEFIYNFKGEHAYRTRELLPDYWSEVREQVNAPRQDEDGNIFLAFRDFRTATLWNGVYKGKEKKLELAQAKGTGQLHDFLKQHGQPVGDFVPDWTLEYDPLGEKVVDVEAKKVNVYKPSDFVARRQDPYDSVPAPVAEVLSHVLGGDQDAFNHFINWLACIVQFRCQTGTAWVWHGIQGTGKGLLLNQVLRPMIGYSNVTAKRMQELDSQFNGFLERCQLLWIEEAEASAFRNASVMDANFKSYIVEPFISVRHMFQAPYEVRSFINMIISSNKDDPVVLDPHDRRFSIGAFQALKLLITEAGVEALGKAAFPFYCYLMAYKADRARARTPLNNAAKLQMIHINRPSIDVLCDALLAGHLQFFRDQRPSGPLDSLPRFEQDKAAAYAALVDKLPKMGNITRDEIFILADYAIGGVPAAPAKFAAFLKHHRVHLASVRRGEEVHRGVSVKWKESGS